MKKTRTFLLWVAAKVSLTLILAVLCVACASSGDSSEEGQAFLMRGKQYASNGEYENAVEEYTEALLRFRRNSGDAAFVHQVRGNAYREMGDYDRAIADYEASLRIVPDNPGVMQALEEARQARAR